MYNLYIFRMIFIVIGGLILTNFSNPIHGQDSNFSFKVVEWSPDGSMIAVGVQIHAT